MRLLLAMMKHETNTFSPVLTDLARFSRAGGPRPDVGAAAVAAGALTGRASGVAVWIGAAGAIERSVVGGSGFTAGGSSGAAAAGSASTVQPVGLSAPSVRWPGGTRRVTRMPGPGSRNSSSRRREVPCERSLLPAGRMPGERVTKKSKAC